jgi:hypothetical protein
MSKKSSVQDFMAKSSLFKNDKNKMHSSYITHKQYFSGIKDQKVNHSHLNYLNSSPIGKISSGNKSSLLSYSANEYSDFRPESSGIEGQYSQIYPYKKL